MSKTIIVRVMVPQEGESFSSGFVGHYDMQVVGNNISFLTDTYNDPVFSFGPHNDDMGLLHVFNGNQSFSVYKKNSNYEKCDVYKWTTVVSDEQYTAFIRHICGKIVEKYINPEEEKEAEENGEPLIGNRYYFSPYTLFCEYHKSYVNCYRAVASWLNSMGINTLWNIFANAYPEHLKYSSAAMVEKFAVSGKWEKVASV